MIKIFGSRFAQLMLIFFGFRVLNNVSGVRVGEARGNSSYVKIHFYGRKNGNTVNFSLEKRKNADFSTSNPKNFAKFSPSLR